VCVFTFSRQKQGEPRYHRNDGEDNADAEPVELDYKVAPETYHLCWKGISANKEAFES